MDARLQIIGGAGPPKWDPQARIGIYLGHSPSNAGSVVLVINPKSGLVYPKFHLAFDDNFKTLLHIWAGTVPGNREELVASSKEKSIEGFYYVTKTWFEG